MSTGKIVPILNIDKLSNVCKHIEIITSYWIPQTFSYLLSLEELKVTCDIAWIVAHLLRKAYVLKALFLFPIFKEVLGMELLHDSSGLVGSLDCQLKSLEKKINESQPDTIMKDLHRQVGSIKKLEKRARDKFTEMASQIKATEAMVADKHKDLMSKINDINSRIDDLEKKIDFAVRELKSEARKTSFLRKLLWLD